MDLKFSHIDILVADLDKAVAYYKRVLGCTPSRKEVWKRGDFHVEYVVMFKDATRFFLVRPYSGNLKTLMDKKGEGTIYRYCFTSKSVKACFKELVAAGVQPENENAVPLKEDDLDSPIGMPIVWLPRVFGDLSMEILEEKPMEAYMTELRENAPR
ncbi:MAG: VOC family protein [Alphaproteobacteria bacterium]